MNHQYESILRRELKNIPSRRNPLDPISRKKSYLTFLLITYKHIEKLPKSLIYFFNTMTIFCLLIILTAENNSSDFIYNFTSSKNLQKPFLMLIILTNISFFLFFLLCSKMKNSLLNRENALPDTRILFSFSLFAYLIKIFSYIIFPLQILTTLQFLRCKGKITSQQEKEICESFEHKIYSGIFIINLIPSTYYIFLSKLALTGTLNNRDPNSSTVRKKIEIFQVVLILTEIVLHAPNWGSKSQVLRKRLSYLTCFLVIVIYQIYNSKSDGLFDQKSRRIYYLGLSLVTWTSLRQFIWTLVDSNSRPSGKFQNLILILELSIGLKIFWNRLMTKKIALILKHEYERNLSDEFTLIKEILLGTEKLISTKIKEKNKKKKKFNFEFITLKGVYKNHQKQCVDINCSCYHDQDNFYGNNNLIRFRDFFLKELSRIVERNPYNFFIRYYYFVFIMKYKRNLCSLTAQLQNLKPLAKGSFIKSLIFYQLEIKMESLFKEIYKKRRKIDGLDPSSFGEEDQEYIEKTDTFESLVNGKRNEGNLELFEFIEMDKIFNNMLDRMRDSIDIHQIFISSLQNRNTSLKFIHELVQSLVCLHQKVDQEFLNLKKIAFEYTSFHLLPYGFFKNQTQNGIKECNLMLREFRSKARISIKNFLNFNRSIKNISGEKDSVCFLFSMSEDDFMDIFYVTRTYERVFGASISFDQANLVDILPHSISDIHQEIVKDFLQNLNRNYFSEEKSGVLSLKEYLYEQVTYAVSVYPSTILKPMIAVYAKKEPLEGNRYMFLLNSAGNIEGCSRNLGHLFPNVKELMGKKVEFICKGIKKNIENFRFHFLSVEKFKDDKKLEKCPGFVKSNMKKYQDDWEELNFETGKGKKAIFIFLENFRIEVSYKLKMDYFEIGKKSDYTIRLIFKVETILEEKEFDEFEREPKKKFTFCVKKCLRKVRYISKMKLFAREDIDSKEIRIALQGEKVDKKIKTEFEEKKKNQERKKKGKIKGTSSRKKLEFERKNSKRLQRGSFFQNTTSKISSFANKKKEINSKEETKKDGEKNNKGERKTLEDDIQLSSKQVHKTITPSKFSKKKEKIKLKNLVINRKKRKRHTPLFQKRNKKPSKEKNVRRTESFEFLENLGSSEKGSIKASNFLKKIRLSNNFTFFNMNKYNLLIIFILLLNIALVIIAMIVVQIYFTQNKIKYLEGKNCSKIFVYITNSIKMGYEDMMKLSLIQESHLKKDRFQILLKSKNTKNEIPDWYKEMGLEDSKKFYRDDLERRINNAQYFAQKLKNFAFESKKLRAINLIYETYVPVYYWDHFHTDVEKGLKMEEMTWFNLMSYILLNMRQMLIEDNFSKDSVMFSAVDRNIPTGLRRILYQIKLYFGKEEFESFVSDSDFAVDIAAYFSIIIGFLTFLTIPIFWMARQNVIKIYQTLQDLYDFELRYKMSLLDELEDALDVCQENLKVVEGLIQSRRLSTSIYYNLKKKDNKKSFQKFKIPFFYSFGMFLYFLPILLAGISQTLEDLYIYNFSKNKFSLMKEQLKFDQGIYSLYYDSTKIYIYTNRYILEKSGFAPNFQGFNDAGNKFQEHTLSLANDRKESMQTVHKKMYSCLNCEGNFLNNLILDSPCEELKSKNLNKKPMKGKFMNEEFCLNFADGLTKYSYFKSFMWLRVQERIIKNEIMEKEGDDLFEILESKNYIDYELYAKFILNEFQEIFDEKFDGEIDEINEEINRDIVFANSVGLLCCTLIVTVAYFYYYTKSKRVLEESVYIVKLIPVQTLSENTYVANKLAKILGFVN